MTLTIAPQIESELLAVAKLEGIDPSAIVEQLLSEHLPQRAAKDREYARRVKLLKEIMEETEELGLYQYENHRYSYCVKERCHPPAITTGDQ